MKIVYPGHMTGYHVIGKKGVKLNPGVNEVDEAAGRELIARDLVIPIEQTHHREKTKAELELIEDEPIGVFFKGAVDESIEDDGRAEGGE